MPIEIIVPRLGWSMEEGTFVAWLKQDGETVRAGDALFSIEGDKAVQEIESIDNGTLRITPNAPKPGDPIRVGLLLGHLLAEGEAPSSTSPAASAQSASNKNAPCANKTEPHLSFSPGEKAGMRGNATHDNQHRSEHAQTALLPNPAAILIP